MIKIYSNIYFYIFLIFQSPVITCGNDFNESFFETMGLNTDYNLINKNVNYQEYSILG